MAKQEPEAVDHPIQTYGGGDVRRGNNGRRREAEVNGANIFYALLGVGAGGTYTPRRNEEKTTSNWGIQDPENDDGV